MLDDLKVTRYEDDLEVVLDAAIAIDGEDGVGVLPGGLLGQILTKASATDFDTLWADPSAGVPNDGTAGQLLSKVSSDPYDTLWINPPEALPAGGATGTMLGKLSATDYDVGWIDPVTGLYLPLTGGGDVTGPVTMEHLTVTNYLMSYSNFTIMHDATDFSGATMGAARIYLVSAPAASGAYDSQIHFKAGYTAGDRWILGKQNDAETGTNTGSSFKLTAHNDTGGSLGDVFKVTRATRLVNFLVTPTAPTVATVGANTTELATTAFVKRDYAGLAAINTFAGAVNSFQLISATSVNVNKAATDNIISLGADSGKTASISLTGATGTRWRLSKNAIAEIANDPSPNTGSDFSLDAYGGTIGTLLGNVFTVTRTDQVLTFTKSPIAPTPTVGDNTTQLATTAFVNTAITAGGGAYAPLAGATFTGSVLVTGVASTISIDKTGQAANASLNIYSDNNYSASLYFRTGAETRWALGRMATPTETGSGNTGSPFGFFAYDDDGSFLGNVFLVTRATRVVDFAVTPTVLGVPIGGGGGGQPLDATLTALAALDATAGFVEQTGIDAFTKRATNTFAYLAAANTFTAGQTINMGDVLPSNCLTLTSTWGSASAGPFLYLSRLSPDPAALDEIGQISFVGKDSGLVDTTYASIGAIIVDPTNGSEDSKLRIRTVVGSNATTIATFETGVLVGTSTGGDKGANTLNANTLYEAGVTLASKYEGLGVVAGINTQTASYTLVLTDAGKVVEVNNASANTLTVPPNSTVAFPLNTRIDVAQYGAGQTTITPGAGVTIRQREAKLKLTGQYAGASLYKRGTDEWVLFGDLAT